MDKAFGQNVATAEHEAATMEIEKGARQEVLADCAAVQRMANKPNEEMCKRNKVHAVYWNRINTVEIPCSRTTDPHGRKCRPTPQY